MELNPDEARLLVGVLLDDDDESVGGELGDRLADRRAQLGTGEFGRYRLLRLVGTGGMGEVYEAEQDHPRRRVALKVIRADVLSPEAAARFDHEARILGRLQHPGIARIYEAGRNTAQGVAMPYFAMEFVEGRALLDHVRQQHLTVKARLELFVRICEAVEHAHRMGVIHRDLKPGNILVDGSGQPRVLDFGVARATDSDVQATSFRTDMGRLVGTLAYMSPEQVSVDPAGLDTRSDVYALGVLLYELLSGRAPYKIDAARIHEAARVITQTEPDPLSTTDRALRGDVQTIVTKALAKERDRRYQSVGELAADIRRYLKDEPIEARPPSAMYQVTKFARRNRALVVASAAVLASIVGAAVVSTVFAVRELEAKKEAQTRATALGEEKAITAEISDFLSNTFVALAPQQLGRDAKVVDAVRQGIEKLEGSPPANARVEAELRHAFGYALNQLGDFDLAVSQLQKARDLTSGVAGPRSDDVARISLDLAEALAEASRLDEAERVLKESVDIRTEVRGPEDPLTLRAKSNLLECMMRQARFGEAEPLLESLLEVNRRVQGEHDPATISTLHNLASTYAQLDKTDEAMRLARTVLNYEPPDNETAVEYFSTWELLGGLEHRAGNLKEAEAIQRKVLEARRKVYGDDHYHVFISRGRVAEVLLDQGRLEEAEAELRSLLADEAPRMGVTHRHYIDNMCILSAALGQQNRNDEALAVMDTLIGQIDGQPSVPAWLVASCRVARANRMRSCEHWEDALAEVRRAWDTFQVNPPPYDAPVYRAARLLVVALDYLDRSEEADEFRTFLTERGQQQPVPAKKRAPK